MVYVLTPVAFHSGLTTTCRTCEAALVWAESMLTVKEHWNHVRLNELQDGRQEEADINSNKLYFLGTWYNISKNIAPWRRWQDSLLIFNRQKDKRDALLLVIGHGCLLCGFPWKTPLGEAGYFQRRCMSDLEKHLGKQQLSCGPDGLQDSHTSSAGGRRSCTCQSQPAPCTLSCCGGWPARWLAGPLAGCPLTFANTKSAKTRKTFEMLARLCCAVSERVLSRGPKSSLLADNVGC